MKCASSLSALSFELKNSGFLYSFEWIEIIYFKFTQVDFISGQLKFKKYERMSKHNLWLDLTYENRRNYLFIEAPIFFFFFFFVLWKIFRQVSV